MGILDNCTDYSTVANFDDSVPRTPKSDPQLPFLSAIALDTFDKIYIATDNFIRKYDRVSGSLTTIAGGGNDNGTDIDSLSASLSFPGGTLIVLNIDYIIVFTSFLLSVCFCSKG